VPADPAPLLLLAATLAVAPSQERAKAVETTELQERAARIVRDSQQNEITTSEARRRVELLLRDLRRWGQESGVELSRRTRTFSTPAVSPGEALTADRCPLFFEEDLERLCPLDFSRSEVWGAIVVFCRYLCAPEPR
jgi:hypothetical protein